MPPPRRSPEPLRPPGPLATLVSSPDAREAIARVAYAEAANQGDSGLAGVVYTIINRLADGRWGGSVEAVVNARRQFEPVMRAGGSWRSLPAVSEARQARIDTIINLALEGRLPDPTNGARFFQNPQIVAGRAARGEVSAGLVNFGGAPPSAVIGAHSFYVEAGRGGGSAPGAGRSAAAPRGRCGILTLGSQPGARSSRARTGPSWLLLAAAVAAPTETPDGAGEGGDRRPQPADGARAIFVRQDGTVAAWRQ
jgi:N-acetylmuramoyl-L-alanine amidase